MGSLCPRIFQKRGTQKQTPYDVHQTFEIEDKRTSADSEANNNFQTLTEEPLFSANGVVKQASNKPYNKFQKDSTLFQRIELPQSSQQQSGQQNLHLTQKSSTKSFIRKHLHETLGSSQSVDENLENLYSTKKIITNIHNPDRKVFIKGCKKSKIFIFDTSSSIIISQCSQTIIFCAPCSGKVSIVNCKQLKVIIACSKLQIKKSRQCDISLFCVSPTTLQGSSEICLSNFQRIGYYGMIDQMSGCGFQVWNNKILQVQDLDKSSEEQHFSQKKLHVLQIQWPVVVCQGGLQPADPVIPVFWLDFKLKKNKQILVMNQPMRQIQLKLLKHIISNNISIHKSFKGVLSNEAFSKMRSIFQHHQQNSYLCIMIGKQLESSGFQAYFEKINGKQLEQIEPYIFPSFQMEE